MSKPLLHLVIALVLLAATAAAYVFWYLHVSGTRAEVTTLKAEAGAIEVEAAGISSARAALSKLAAAEAFFGSYFVSTTSVVSFLEDLEATGEELGSTIEVVSVTPDSGARLSVALRASGSFAAAMRTIGAVEYGPYDLVVTDLTVDTNASSEGAWTATGAISVGTGAQKEPPARATPPPPEAELDI